MEQLAKLITRSLKLYSLIDSLMKVFTLIEKLDVSFVCFFYSFILENYIIIRGEICISKKVVDSY